MVCTSQRCWYTVETEERRGHNSKTFPKFKTSKLHKHHKKPNTNIINNSAYTHPQRDISLYLPENDNFYHPMVSEDVNEMVHAQIEDPVHSDFKKTLGCTVRDIQKI